MIILNTWQLILAVVVIFLFGWGTGRTMGESRAWEKMDKQEAQGIKVPSHLFHNIERTFGNVVYRTEGSTILSAKKRKHVEQYLLQSPTGLYFFQEHLKFGYEVIDGMEAYTREQAMETYNDMPEKCVGFEEAFGEPLVDA